MATNADFLNCADLDFGHTVDEWKGIIRWSDCGGRELFAVGGEDEADAVEKRLSADRRALPCGDVALTAFWDRVDDAIIFVCDRSYSSEDKAVRAVKEVWDGQISDAKAALRDAIMELEASDDRYANGTVTLDGKRFDVGGGWILSAEAAENENNCQGYSYYGSGPNPYEGCPGFACEGSFLPYKGDETGDIDELIEHLGIDPNNKDGREMVEEWVQEQSEAKFEELKQSIPRFSDRVKQVIEDSWNEEAKSEFRAMIDRFGDCSDGSIAEALYQFQGRNLSAAEYTARSLHCSLDLSSVDVVKVLGQKDGVRLTNAEIAFVLLSEDGLNLSVIEAASALRDGAGLSGENLLEVFEDVLEDSQMDADAVKESLCNAGFLAGNEERGIKI